MKKKIVAVIVLVLLICITVTGCTEANQVSYNISKEADNFNVTRKLTVLNARTDTILLELTGTFALKNNDAKEKGLSGVSALAKKDLLEILKE